MHILRKTVRPGIDVVVNVASAVSFALAVKGTDRSRPENVDQFALSVEAATLLLSADWEVVPLPEKKG